MPTGVTMYVRLREPHSTQELNSLRDEFMRAMALTSEDFYTSGPLIEVPIADLEDLPAKDPNSSWLDVNLWKSYFGPGYERGNAELFVKVADWLEQRLPGSKIYYGHDVGDENVSIFDRSARTELLKLYRSSK